MYRTTQLEQGLRVVTAEMPHMTSVSVGLWVGVGSRFEPAALNGVCHFLEHLLFKGTKKRTAREISEAVEGIGGAMNAFTSEEVTCFHARASADRFDELLDVLQDMLCRSLLKPSDIRKEREVIKEEIAMYWDEPQHLVQELLNEVLWSDQPLGRPITGTPQSLDAMGRSQLAAFLRSHYVTGNTLICAAGNISHRKVVHAAKWLASRLPRGGRPQCAPAVAAQEQPRLKLCTRSTEQTQFALGIRSCSRHDGRRYAVRLLNTVLGENMSSRLFQVVREDHGMAYSIYSTPSFFSDAGDIVISAGVDTDKLPRALRLVMRELRKLVAKPPSRSELNRARDYVLGQIDLSLENTESQMNWIGEQMLGYGRTFPAAHIKQRLARVTPGDIRTAAAWFFRPENMNLSLVSPLKTDRSLRRWYEP